MATQERGPNPQDTKTELDYHDLAQELGLEKPTFTQLEQPQLFQAWAGRVDQLHTYAQRGEADRFEALKPETNGYAGRQPQNSPTLGPAEHIEELRQELKPGALSDPKERAEAQHQLDLALAADPSAPTPVHDPLGSTQITAFEKQPPAATSNTHARQEEQATEAAGAPATNEPAIQSQTPPPEMQNPHANTASPDASSSLSLEQFKDITTRLTSLRPLIEAKDPALAKEIWALDGAASWEPNAIRDPHIQTRLAYALEDAEKLTGKIDLPAAVRDETARLAATSPGLENKQLESLLKQTSSLNDPTLVKDLRDKAAEISGRNGPDISSVQHAVDETKTREEIYALGFRVATAPRITPAATENPQNRAASVPGGNRPGEALETPAVAAANLAKAAGRPARQRDAAIMPSPNEAPASARNHVQRDTDPLHKAQADMATFGPEHPQAPNSNPNRTERAASGASSKNTLPVSDQGAAAPASAPATTRTAGSPANQSSPSQPAPPAHEPPAEDSAQAGPGGGKPQQVTVEETRYHIRPVLGGPFRNLFRNIQEAAKQQLPEATPQQTHPPKTTQSNPQAANKAAPASLASRLGGYNEQRAQPRRDETSLNEAHNAATDAMAAMSRFRATEGAALLNKIQDAAAATKGGMREVLSEMRTNGAYEGLRKEFDALYHQNASFRDSYDQAANALTKYGDKRGAVAAAVQSQPQNPIAGKIKALDEEIAKATSGIPGQTEGQTITEKLAEKAREIVDAILEKLRKTFDRSPDPSPSPSPSPSP